MKLLSCLTLCAFVLQIHVVSAETTLSGVASVRDGDTIEIHGQRLRFLGIDAPEADQTCERNGHKYRCGQQAALYLSDLIGSSPINCRWSKQDKYGRPLVRCNTKTIDLNRQMVLAGWAVAEYAETYLPDEQKAQAAQSGIWNGTFIRPKDFRHGPSQAERDLHGSCLIKGNINRAGRKLYHEPGSSTYGKTKINPQIGERWFCTAKRPRQQDGEKQVPDDGGST